MVRIRAYLFTLSLPFLLIIVGITWSIADGGNRTAIGTFVLGAGFALQLFLTVTIACPKCGKSPYTIGPNMGPLGIFGKPIPDVTCSRCGHDLRK